MAEDGIEKPLNIRTLTLVKRFLSYKSFLIIVLLFILLVLIGLFVPVSSNEQRHHAISHGNLERIANAISAYEADHEGKLPQNLGILFPDYETDIQAFLLGFSDTNYPFVRDLSVHQELIDTFSPYSFMRLKDGRILVVERPGLWRDGKITYFILGKPPGPMSNIGSAPITPIEFERQFANGFPDAPNDPDYQSLVSTRIRSHEYELNYTGKGLQKINKSFQASGKPPITADAARTKVQAAIQPLDPALTWDADNGTLTNDGITSSYIFRCSCIEGGTKTGEELEVMVLLDGTLLVPVKKDLKNNATRR
jgi:hypothetical protein